MASGAGLFSVLFCFFFPFFCLFVFAVSIETEAVTTGLKRFQRELENCKDNMGDTYVFPSGSGREVSWWTVLFVQENKQNKSSKLC